MRWAMEVLQLPLLGECHCGSAWHVQSPEAPARPCARLGNSLPWAALSACDYCSLCTYKPLAITIKQGRLCACSCCRRAICALLAEDEKQAAHSHVVHPVIQHTQLTHPLTWLPKALYKCSRAFHVSHSISSMYGLACMLRARLRKHRKLCGLPEGACGATPPCTARRSLHATRGWSACGASAGRPSVVSCRLQECSHNGLTDSGPMRVQGGCQGRPRDNAAIMEPHSSRHQPKPCLNTPSTFALDHSGSRAQAACQRMNRCSFLRSLSDLRVWMRTGPEVAFAEVAARHATPRHPHLHVAALVQPTSNTSRTPCRTPCSSNALHKRIPASQTELSTCDQVPKG